ncbi:MAG TPA: SusC/RagA family TonB-linked outer membrane protein, partial [Flavobacterium sp.]|nr:SusC/RagA family TonB-linked outer membrane protein [Flavobacterium sp.]
MKTIYTKLFIFLLLLPASMLAQSVSGTVTEQANGLPLPGASIVVQGTSNGTSSDIDGKFTLTGVKNGDVIVVSSIGFTQQTVTYTGQKTLSFALAEEASQLQEVVVQVGYGTVRKKDVTGSVTTVTAKDFNKGAIVTTENLLNGKVAGLTINTSGAPGSGSEIRIRGGASLNASNDPLIVVDGFPITNSTNTGSTSFLASLNPNTIESITVLKDASATAIYGSRASNGVIIITTKKGGKDLKVEYNFQYGAGRLAEKVDVLSANQFRNLIATRYPITDTTAPNYASNLAINNRMGTANTDWQDAIYRDTDLVDNNLTIGGSLFGKIPTRLTLNNTYQEGLRLTNVFQRTSVNVAMNPSFFGDHLKLRVNANYTRERNRFTEAIEGNALRFDPTQPVYDPTSPFDGFFEYYSINGQGNAQVDNLAPRNPVAQLLQRNDNGRNKRFLGNVELDYKFHFLPELRFVANVGFDEANGERTVVVPSTAASAANNGNVPYGNDEFTEEMRRNKLLDVYLNYNKTFGDFNADLTAGYSYQKFEREQSFTSNTLQPGYDGSQGDTVTDTDL